MFWGVARGLLGALGGLRSVRRLSGSVEEKMRNVAIIVGPSVVCFSLLVFFLFSCAWLWWGSLCMCVWFSSSRLVLSCGFFGETLFVGMEAPASPHLLRVESTICVP